MVSIQTLSDSERRTVARWASALTVPSLVCTVEGLLRLGFHATTVLYEEQLHDPQRGVNEVVHGKRAITPLRVA